MDTTPTVELVPLADHLVLARLVKSMREAQLAFFEFRKRNPHAKSDAEFRAARDYERRVDAAVAEVLNRKQRTLPGFEG